MNYQIRKWEKNDLQFLKEMLFNAVYWNNENPTKPIEKLFDEPEISKILYGFGNREGDYSLIAEKNKNSLGAVWYRYWTDKNHSYGYVDQNTPEIGISVKSEYRNNGIGQKLMNKIIKNAKLKGIKQISLSVDQKNFARHMYKKLKFIYVKTVGTSWTMVKTL